MKTTVFDRLLKYAGKYQIGLHFQMWGEGNYNIYIEKNGIDLWSTGGNTTAEEAMKEALKYLNRINRKK